MTSFYLLENEIEFYYSERLLRNRVNGRKITLTPLSCNILLALCTDDEPVLTHPQIMQKAWGERHREVQYATYYQTLLMLRKSIREIGIEYEVVKTITRKGLTLNVTSNFKEEKAEREISDSAKNQLEHPESGKKNRLPYILNTMIISVTILLLAFISIYPHLFFQQRILRGRNPFFGNYVLAGKTENQCMYYFNKDTSSHLKHNYFISKNAFLCERNTRLFITTYSTAKTVSAIRCYLPSTSHDEHCISYYFPLYQPSPAGGL
ncbi:TPA: transcriptional regulator [Klebsiella oxytoca]